MSQLKMPLQKALNTNVVTEDSRNYQEKDHNHYRWGPCDEWTELEMPGLTLC